MTASTNGELCATMALAFVIVASACWLISRLLRFAGRGPCFCRTIIGSCSNPVIILDRQGRIAAADSSAEALVAHTNLPRRSRLIEIVPARMVPSLSACIDEAMRGETSKQIVRTDADKEHGPIAWLVTASPIRRLGGGVCGVILIFADATELAEALDRAERRVAEQSVMLDGTETQIWYLTDRWTYGAANQAHADFIGRKKDGLRHRDVRELTSPRTAELCQEGNTEAFDTRTEVRSEIWVDGPDGKPHCLAVTKRPQLDCNGAVSRVVCTANDITEHKNTEAGLRTQVSAVNAASEQILVTDLRGRIEFANPAFEQETGYTLEEVKGRNPRFLKSGKQDADFYALMWHTILGGRSWHGELVNRRKDGSEYVVQTTITPVKNEEGVVERFVAISRNVTEKKLFEQRMDYLAHHDVLTGLPNRLLIGHKIAQHIARAERSGGAVAVLFLDLDGFKVVNDTMGHKTGDALLKNVADRLRKCCRNEQNIARMGGDEFLIVQPDVRGPEDAATQARKLMSAFSKPFKAEGREVFVSLSIGISLFPFDGRDVDTIVKNADAAMYAAKESGRNRFCMWHEGLAQASAARMDLETSLRRAVERNELVVHYQPRVDVNTGAVVGAEALVRWKRPGVGLVYPDQFIALAEETGTIVDITRTVLRTAAGQNRAWQDAGLPPVVMAVNLSGHQFQAPDTLATLKNTLRESGLDPMWLELELTESILMERPEEAAELLRKMKDIGVRVSIDDFGTGYSSLSYLKRFPVDALKIDKSFVHDIPTRADDVAITRAIVAMAQNLQVKVVAEGVENVEQLRFLHEIGCDEIQGYLVSPAVPAEEFADLLARGLVPFATEVRPAA